MEAPLYRKFNTVQLDLVSHSVLKDGSTEMQTVMELLQIPYCMIFALASRFCIKSSSTL